MRPCPWAAWLSEVMRHVEGEPIAALIADRYKQAELGEAIDSAGIRVPIVWRGFGFRDGGEDFECFKRARFDGRVKARPSLLLRSAFADAVTLGDPANNIEARQGALDWAGSTPRRPPCSPWPKAPACQPARQASEGGDMGVTWNRPSAPVIRSPRWPALRLAAKRRDGWRCVQCGARGRLEVDHVKPVRTHPQLAFDLEPAIALRDVSRAENRNRSGLAPHEPERRAWRKAIEELSHVESVKISRRQSEIRQALAELVGKEKPTEDETRSMTDLDTEYRGNETRYRAALIAEDTERRDAKGELETRGDKEYADLIGKFELRQVALMLDEGKRARRRHGRSRQRASQQGRLSRRSGAVAGARKARRRDRRQRHAGPRSDHADHRSDFRRLRRCPHGRVDDQYRPGRGRISGRRPPPWLPAGPMVKPPASPGRPPTRRPIGL